MGNAHLTDKQEIEINIDALVSQLRKQVKVDIEKRCGTMRILDMTQPIGLSDIYTQVNILEKISGRRRKNITELLNNCDFEDFERFSLGRITEEKILAKEAVTRHRKLLILGKPGAGKTTFLKHLAIQCDRGKFQENLVPFFVTLKDFAEARSQPGLLNYLGKYISQHNQDTLNEFFSKGKALILLDGLDEVLEVDTKRVLKEIRDFSNKFSENQYVMTCGIAAKEYTFEQFTEVEIADFNWEQIKVFATNWFTNKAIKPELFLDRLEKDEPIQELASNPLLLTLLCLAFEESGEFPANRSCSQTLSRLQSIDLFLTSCSIFLSLSKILNISLKQAKKYDRKLHQELQKLRDRLPNTKNNEKFNQWWQANGTTWTEDLRATMIKYRNIGHDWQFSDEQKELLKQYYFANQLLTQCLHQECYVSREVRQEIEETLLLPVAEIEKRKGRR